MDTRDNGSTLIESVIAICVLAVAVPLVFGAVAEGGRSGIASKAETRSAWIIPACLDEIRASRGGRSGFFTATSAGETFPPAGEVWALAFSEDGKTVGRLASSIYDQGTASLDGKDVRFIVSMTAVRQADSPMLRVDLLMEYPASAPAARRGRLEFHTRMP